MKVLPRARYHSGMTAITISAAVLLAAVSLQVLAMPHGLPLAAVRSPATSSPGFASQMGRVKDLAPGTLLVAARRLGDPNFIETVIVLVDHSDDGTMGLVVNRRTSVPLSRVFQTLPEAQGQSAPVYVGGPVSMTAVQALVRSTAAVPEGRQVTSELHIIGTHRALEERLHGPGDPDRFRVYLGYAGWSPGQLANEVGVGAWHIFPADADVVFDPEPDTLWRRQIRQTEFLLAATVRPPPRVRPTRDVRALFPGTARTGSCRPARPAPAVRQR